MKGVHVLGDATLSAPAMPKSGSMANNHAKIAAAAIVELLNGRDAAAGEDHQHLLQLRVATKEAIRVSSVHEWDAEPGHAGRGEGLGRRVGRAQRGRRHLRLELGAHHLGGFAGAEVL